MKEMKRRAKELHLTCNEDGSICTANVVKAVAQAHKLSLEKKNSLWKTGQHVESIFSADALQTARGEKHTVAAIRDLNRKIGYTSAFQYTPVSNTLTGTYFVIA